MKTRKMVAMFTVLAMLGAGYVLADADHHESGNMKDGKSHMGHEGMMGHKGSEGMMSGPMQEYHQTMMAQMDSLDNRLEEKLAVAKKAQGDEKVDALIAVVEELVTQRRIMHEGMMDMMPQMMGQMRQHMGPEMMKGMHGMTHETGIEQQTTFLGDYPEWE